jgi:glucose/arabinose dehydrogenase
MLRGRRRGRRHERDVRRGQAAPLVVLVLTMSCTTVDGGAPPAPPTPPTPAPSTPPAPPPTPERSEGEAPGLPAADVALPELRLEEVVVLEAPTDTALLADGTVLVAERSGVVRVLLGEDAGRVVLDVSDRTTTEGERGLLSIAATAAGDELFISMTDEDGDTLVEAYPLSGALVTGPPRTVYTLEQPFPNHNGGQILLLTDGTLLLGLGDGGGAGDPLGAGQDLTTPLGAIVRLDVGDGLTRMPDDNPFRSVDGAAPEIVAIGLRNPWRMHLDAERDELWIADVGQSEREEINRIPLEELPGANFGWALREGDLPYLGEEPEGHVPPIHVYGHGPGCSVTGGVVYRGASLPALVGAYVFADLCDGELRILVDDRGVVTSRSLGVSGDRIVAFGTDADGELMVLELGGRVLRLRPR